MSILRRIEQLNRERAGEASHKDDLTQGLVVPPTPPKAGPTVATPSDHAEIVLAVVTRLAEESQRGEAARPEAVSDGVLRRAVDEKLVEVLQARNRAVSRAERARLVKEVLNEIKGLGPIEDLVQDPDISEVMVNGPQMVYIERNGLIEETDVTFRDDAHIVQVIEKILAPLGRRVDEQSPMVDARLADGSRVNAVIPPVAVSGPTLTIRKFAAEPLRSGDLVRLGTLTPDTAIFLEGCVRGRLSIVVAGGTATGKTTLLNVLSGFIPDKERIVTIEDAAELSLLQRHVVTLESRPANLEGKGRITIRDLVINALRMRPDRIIVGEVRGGEALDMLQAMNTGHEGSLTTVHTNSPRDLFSRLETMVLMAGTELPVRAIREQIAAAVDLIVQLERMIDGTRKVVQITEVLGMEGDTITTQDIFAFEHEGFDSEGFVRGHLRPTGIVPHFLQRLKTHGVSVDHAAFQGFIARDASEVRT